MNDFNIWYIIKDNNIFNTNFNFFIAREIKSNIYQFILPYNSILHPIINNGKLYNNSINVILTNKERINQIKFSVVKNATDRLKNIFDINIISDNSLDYLDISYNDINSVTFLPKNKIKLVLTNNLDPYNNKFRKSIKIGRLLLNHSVLDLNQYPKSIEIATNIYKHIIQSITNDSKLKIVSGEDIRHWYLENNYDKGNGTLSKSCMRYQSSQELFDIYVYNPNVCKLLIKINPSNNKLQGRALLWKTNKGIFMDRIYTIQDHHLYDFIGHATKNNWLSRSNINIPNMEVKLKSIYYGDCDENPYMDTFKYLYKNILYNKRPMNNYEYLDCY